MGATMARRRQKAAKKKKISEVKEVKQEAPKAENKKKGK